MFFSTLKNIRISGIFSVVPPKELLLTDEKNLYNGDKRRTERVIKSSGFLKRHVTDSKTTTADLCEYAANHLINELHIDRSQIDALVFVSYTPDFLMPATSYVLHKKLGLGENCLALDIPQGCSGYVIGLFQSGVLLNSSCKKVLLLVGDSFSKFSDMFKDHSAPIFGDAGSATLLEYDQNAEPMFFNMITFSSKYDTLICRNGGFRNPPKKDLFYDDGAFKYDASMNGCEVFEFTIQTVAPRILEMFEHFSIDKNEIDYFILHQANRYILENIAIQLGVGIEKIPCKTLSNFGNQCGASIPCSISNTLYDKVSSKHLCLLLSGFGVGLSIANVLMRTNPFFCSKIEFFNR